MKTDDTWGWLGVAAIGIGLAWFFWPSSSKEPYDPHRYTYNSELPPWTPTPEPKVNAPPIPSLSGIPRTDASRLVDRVVCTTYLGDVSCRLPDGVFPLPGSWYGWTDNFPVARVEEHWLCNAQGQRLLDCWPHD